MATEARICAIMPAFNEEETIRDVILEVRKQMPQADIVVMNDASSDTTAQVAEEAGAEVLTLPYNLGIGGAVQTGLKYAQRNGYDVAIEIDSDGQHDPKYIREVAAGVITEGADMAIGSRFVKSTAYRSSVLRMFGIHVFSALIKFVSRKRIYDSTSGYRAYSCEAIEFLAPRYPIDFPEPESIVLLLMNRFTIVEVPVVMRQRTHGESVVGKSDFSLKAAYFVASNSIAIILAAIRQKARYAR